jgi:hypothetical protein
VTALRAQSLTFPLFVRNPAGGRPVMPPPPAALLSDYEADVLIKWGMTPARTSATSRARNRPPEMRVIGEPRWDGNDVTLLIEVWDPDKDQVLGKVTAGQASVFIPSAGRREVTVTGANRNDPITVLLHDGYDSKSFDL